MNELKVEIEINGERTVAGTISGGSSDAVFCYDASYMSAPGARPVSVSLPFKTGAFSPLQTAVFFEGLLPEGFTRRAVAQWMHASEYDYVSILHGLGRECLGAIRITDGTDADSAGYKKLSMEEVGKLASEGAARSAELVVKSHLSLTGASGKVGLYYDSPNDAWYLPQGSAPSTHIVKQSHVRLDGIVLNEQLVLKTAKYCGIDAADAFVINTGTGNDDEILLASKRYDRSFVGSSKTADGKLLPLRLHQEDLAQALGIASADKYEKQGDRHMKRAFDLLRRYSSDPIRDQRKLWDLIVFNFLVGNTDGHLKNVSLLYSSDLKSISLAPAYDIVSTAAYPSCTRDMAFSIGGAFSLDDIDLDSFRKAADEVGITQKQAIKRITDLCNAFEKALSSASDDLSDLGLPGMAPLKERILDSGGFRRIT